jgi:hypothetical protein
MALVCHAIIVTSSIRVIFSFALPKETKVSSFWQQKEPKTADRLRAA